MTNPSFSSTLYDCATECALRRQSRKCKESFGSYACNDCRLYVNRYVDADPRKVDLFMLEAERRAYDFRAALRYPFIVIAILIGIVILILFMADLRKAGYRIPPMIKPKIEASTAAATPQFALATGNYVKDIEDTLRRVATAMRANTDVNGDGLVNCIDAAVLFYQWYPRRSEVTIIHNLNGTKMNHLFNGVKIGDDEWRGIEPQAYFSNRASFYMTDIWGSSYEHTRNTDVTADYSKFVR